MVDHFNESVFGAQLLMGGKGRAMVVTDGVNRAIDYYLAISDYISGEGTALPGHHRLLGGTGPQRQDTSARHP